MKFSLSIKASTEEMITPAKIDPSVMPINIVPTFFEYCINLENKDRLSDASTVEN